MMNKKQLYAKFYDLEYQNKRDDVNFYYHLAQKIDGPILECACGAGRILIPIAQSGKRIWGFDVNAEMLKIAKEKTRLSKIWRDNKIFQDDLTKFSSHFLKNKKFKFIFLSFDSLAYVAQKDETFYSLRETRQRQHSTLENIAKHLDSGGLFAFDLFSPNNLSREYIVRHHFSRVINGRTWNLFSSIHVPAKHFFQINYLISGIIPKLNELKIWLRETA